jgi:Pao retrotransposon peptidase
VENSGEVKVTFLYSQSKVSPMSKITLPRLELCGALLLAKLLSHVISIYSPRHKIDRIFALSDSMITLNWIKTPNTKLTSFVSNRVLKIQELLPSHYWFFIPGKENVVDCASRGLLPVSLVNHPTWFPGPKWLLLEPQNWPIETVNKETIEIDDSEYLPNNFTLTTTIVSSPFYSLIENSSSWSRLLNSVVYVLRFIKKLPLHKHIQISDWELAELQLIRGIQQNISFTNIRLYLKIIVSNLPFVV